MQSENIKVWDPRMTSMVYEIATGNNAVLSLAWDAPRSTLYAATESYSMGFGRDTNVPSTYWNDEKYGKNAEHVWPSGAYHPADAFGFAFDAGKDGLCEYTIRKSMSSY